MIKEFKGKYSVFSNFELVDIELDGRTYPSVEHAYMSAKNDSPEWKDKCTDKLIRPGSIKKLGRKVKLVENWEDIKVEVMEKCLRQKFSKEPYKSVLESTGDELIQEGNWWNDKIWGICLKTGEGENLLGKLLMKIRDEYNN